MSRHSPWSVKGVSPETREAAKGLARKNGMPLGEFLNSVISDIDNGATPSPSNAPSNGPSNSSSSGPSNSFGQGQTAQAAPPASMDTRRLAEALETLSRQFIHPAALTPIANAGDNNAVAAPIGAPQMVPQNNGAESQFATRLARLEQETKTAQEDGPRALESARALEQALAKLARKVDADVADLSDSQEHAFGQLKHLDDLHAQLLARMGELQSSTHGAISALSSANETFGSRILALEEASDADMIALKGRLDVMDNTTALAIEATDQGINLLRDRLEQMEGVSAEIQHKLTNALVDLSARISSLENGPANQSFEKIERKVAGIDTHVHALDRRVDDELNALRGSLSDTVDYAIAQGLDSRFEQLASALNLRLEQAESESKQSVEKMGESIGKIAQALDARLARMESADPQKASGTALKMELAKISRAIDMRLNAMSEEFSKKPDQAMAQLEGFAETFDHKIKALENRAGTQVTEVSAEIQKVIARLESRDEDIFRTIESRVDEAEARTRLRQDEIWHQTEGAILAAEERAKAAASPLHRGFETLLSRFEDIEQQGAGMPQIGQAPMHGNPRNNQSFAPAQNFTAPSINAQANNHRSEPAQFNGAPQGFGGFASPMPPASFGNEASDEDMLFDPGQSAPANFGQEDISDDFDFSALSGGEQSPAPTHVFDDLELGEALLNDPQTPYDDGEIDVWPLDDATSTSVYEAAPRQGNFLDNARRAAIEAAGQVDLGGTKANRRKPEKPKRGPREAKAPSHKSAQKAAQKADGPRSAFGLSPVGMVAAAGLVLVGGTAAYMRLHAMAAETEMPQSLVQEPKNVSADELAAASAATNSATNITSDATLEAGTPPGGTRAPDIGTTTVPEATGALTDNTGLTQVARPAPPGQNGNSANHGASTRLTPAPSAHGATGAPMRTSQTPTSAPANTQGQISPLQALAARENAQARSLEVRAAAVRTGSAQTPPRSQHVTPNNASASRPATQLTPATRTAARQPVREAAQSPQALLSQARTARQRGDMAAAARLTRQAANAGMVSAQNELAAMYERGEGVPRSLTQARQWTERAANAGSSRAQHNLGVYYAEGQGAPRDYSRARESFSRAAQAGNTDSQYNLGAMAEQGIGRDRNNQEAAYWYGLAARSGDTGAAAAAARARAALNAADQAKVDADLAAFHATGTHED